MSYYRKKVGADGEDQAAKYLKAKGYRIIEMNWHCWLGEIDIISKDADTLVFCEVKTRSNQSLGHPLEAITVSKQEKLRRLGEAYIQVTPNNDTPLRFDVISIIANGDGNSLEHIKDAF